MKRQQAVSTDIFLPWGVTLYSILIILDEVDLAVSVSTIDVSVLDPRHANVIPPSVKILQIDLFFLTEIAKHADHRSIRPCHVEAKIFSSPSFCMAKGLFNDAVTIA